MCPISIVENEFVSVLHSCLKMLDFVSASNCSFVFFKDSVFVVTDAEFLPQSFQSVLFLKVPRLLTP